MRLVLLTVLLSPASAAADPISFFSAVSSFLGGGTILQVGLAIAGLVYGAAQKRKQERKAREDARNAHNAGLQERTVTHVSSDSPYIYAYGETRVGSLIVAMFTTGDKDQYKHLVCVHAAHECESIEEIYIANTALGRLDGSGNVTSGPYLKQETLSVSRQYLTEGAPTITIDYVPIAGTVTVVIPAEFDGLDISRAVPFSIVGTTITLQDLDLGQRLNDITGSYEPWVITVAEMSVLRVSYQHIVSTPRVRVTKHLGTPSDPVDATLQSEVGAALWPSTSVLRGFCYTVVRLDLYQPEFQSGIPNIEVLLRGKKLYDPRNATTTWSHNPARVVMDYLTSELCGVSYSVLPEDDYITAANVCDEAQSFGPLYTINGTVTSGEDQKQVLERMAQAMAGGIVGASWRIWAGKYVAPVMALTQSDIVGKLSVNPGVSDADLYNGVRGQFISAENTYVATDYGPYQNATYLAADGRELWSNIDFAFTNTKQRVHNLARIFVEDQRNGFTLKAEMSLKSWAVKIGQRVTFTSSLIGQSAKVYRVTDKSFSPSSAVELTLKEDASSIWDLADAVTLDATPNTNLPDPFDDTPLGLLTCESGTEQLLIQSDGTVVTRILASWPEVTAQAVFTGGLIEIEWSEVGIGAWQKATVSGDATEAYLSPVRDGFYYDVRARTVNPYFNVKSDWTYAASHFVVGKTEPPDDISFFAVASDGVATWAHVIDKDLAGYRIRWQPGNNRSWGDASDLHLGLLTDSPYQILIRPSGVATYMIKAVDTSGNESENLSASVINLGDPIVANVVTSYDYKANSWPGTVSGATVVGANLVATADASPLAWDPNENTAGWTLDTDPGWTLSTYGPVSYLPDVYIVANEDDGCQLTFPTTIAGTAYLVEYRRDGDALGWTSDAEPGWTNDAALAWDVEDFRPWPGAVTARPGRYEWRITIQSRDVQGVISAATAKLDVEDQVENVGLVSILASGTVIPTTKTWRAVTGIGLTLVADGGTARTTRVESLSTRTVTTRDSTNVAVDGSVLATIQGY